MYTKDIKDFIHFYLGQLAEITRKDASIVDDITPATIANVLAEIVTAKPVLRPLSDITNAEKIVIATLVLYRYQKHYDRLVDLEIKDDGSVYVKNEQFAVLAMITVEKDGISYSGGLTSTDKQYFVPNQYEVTRFLLKRGFDLFGLIEDGLAINKTTGK